VENHKHRKYAVITADARYELATYFVIMTNA